MKFANNAGKCHQSVPAKTRRYDGKAWLDKTKSANRVTIMGSKNPLGNYKLATTSSNTASVKMMNIEILMFKKN